MVSSIVTGTTWHPLTFLTPTAYALAALTEAATAAILWSFRRYAPKPAATVFLASVYLTIGAIALVMLVATALDPHEGALPTIGVRAIPYLSFLWKAMLGVSALGYVFFRRTRDARSGTELLSIALIVPMLTAILVTAVFSAIDALPLVAVGTTRVGSVYSHLLAPLAMIAGVIGAAVVLRMPGRDAVDRAFGYALIAVVAETATTALIADRGSPWWFFARFVYLGGTMWVFVTAIRGLLDSRAQLHLAEIALHDVKNQSRRQAERARAIWQIASNAKENVPARLPLLLDIGRQVIGRGARSYGSLSHLDRGTIEVDAGAGPPDLHRSRAAFVTQPGASFPAARSLQSALYAEGRAAYWNDLRPLAGNGMNFEQAGFEHVIGAPIQVGETTYFLMFAVDQRLDEPFDDGDLEFVEILATVVAQQLGAILQRERLRHERDHDALTGLDNRPRFHGELRACVARAEPFALAFIDLDRLGAINESAGHALGDRVLVAAANAIRAVAPDDFVARVSGDNFAVILRGVRALEDVSARLADYVDVFRTPFTVGERGAARAFALTASFGAVLFAEGATSDDDLVRSADVALSVAKRRGGDTVVMFDPVMTEHIEHPGYTSVELADAIEGAGLSLVYQPTFDLRTRQITGAEALVRWQHPTRGAIPPVDFVEFAERNGLIGRLSRWITDRVIADLKSMPWIPEGYRCNFNLATPQIEDPAFIADLEQRLRFVSTLTHHLGVEITETTAVNGTETARFALQRFRQLGVRVAIDDFGTGYSSLSYLKRLPVDMIKIDRSFVTGLPDDERDAALCDLLLGIANRFKLIALAEGIETEEQYTWLRDHGCEAGQGYLLGRPMSFAMFSRLIAEYAPPPESEPEFASG